MAQDYHANPPLGGGISWTKSDINDAGRLATVDPDSHNAVVDSGLFRKILVRIELK
jgi:hypothetical protein